MIPQEEIIPARCKKSRWTQQLHIAHFKNDNIDIKNNINKQLSVTASLTGADEDPAAAAVQQCQIHVKQQVENNSPSFFFLLKWLIFLLLLLLRRSSSVVISVQPLFLHRSSPLCPALPSNSLSPPTTLCHYLLPSGANHVMCCCCCWCWNNYTSSDDYADNYNNNQIPVFWCL